MRDRNVIDVCFSVCVCVCVLETYLFLTSTQWRENQTKGLEPSVKKTILQYLTAIQTPTLFVLFRVGVCNRKRVHMEKGKESLKKKKVNRLMVKKMTHTHEFRQFTLTPHPSTPFPPIAIEAPSAAANHWSHRVHPLPVTLTITFQQVNYGSRL